ncbi:Endonuclease/exonuclease/phosphatase, partial [Lactarius deliciosus]
MKNNGIAILAVQETHLDEQNTEAIHRALGKRLLILNSQPESNPRTSAGVAFVINKDLIATDQIKTYELIKGRASAINLKWKNDEESLLINVYAPNRRGDHQTFWDKLNEEQINKHLRKPDFILGDFNVTEEPIDRSPPKHDNAGVVEALRDFRLNMEVQDQWRHAHPKAREFMYHTITNDKPVKSRLDRIYVARNKAKYTFDWNTAPSSVPTDHWLVTVKYAPRGTPHIGDGRWTCLLQLLKDQDYMERVEKRGTDIQKNIEHIHTRPAERTNFNNPQTIWNRFK